MSKIKDDIDKVICEKLTNLLKYFSVEFKENKEVQDKVKSIIGLVESNFCGLPVSQFNAFIKDTFENESNIVIKKFLDNYGFSTLELNEDHIELVNDYIEMFRDLYELRNFSQYGPI